MAPNSAFTAEQLEQYLELIQLPAAYRPAANPARDYAMLHALHVRQLATVPYENLLLHYSGRRAVLIDPPSLWQKIVAGGRGRGGYCLENCIFFNHILRAIGFDAYMSGAHIRLRQGTVPQGNYVGWRHIVNIVTLHDGQQFMVDVSFGGDGPTRPLRLAHEQPCVNLGMQEVQLVWASLPEQVSAQSKSWIYQYRNGPDMPWNSYYSFNQVEWLESDFEGPNYYVSTHADSFQRAALIVVKFIRGHEESIVAKRMLAGAVVKENAGGKTIVLRECKTEEERVGALQELFGITLTLEERSAILGYVTQIV